jgi:beta-N-acetylhexosaminidase
MSLNFSWSRRDLFKAAAGNLGTLAIPQWGVAGNPPNIDLRSLSLEQKIGQMIIVTFDGGYLNTPGAQTILGLLQKGAIGGVLFSDSNLLSPSPANQLADAFWTEAHPLRPFLCVDQEGGAISRLKSDRGFEPLFSAKKMATLTPELAEAYYERAAQQLFRLGFNVNLAPVVDLDINESSPIIGKLGRSYSKDPDLVAKFAEVFIAAHHKHHILTAMKHFPGHGSTAADSHRTLPDITATWRKEELIPYRNLILAQMTDMIMVGHLVHSAITESGRPASLSRRAVGGLLRGDLNYSGVVISDDMQMGALAQHFSADERILLGVEAGVDLFVYNIREHPDPEMPERFHRVVASGIARGRIGQTDIDQSLLRISALKRRIEIERAALLR